MEKLLWELSEGLAQLVAETGPSVVRVEGRHRLHATGIVLSESGVIVTAHHVLERDEDIRVGLPDGRLVPATLVGRDPGTDLAVLRAELSGSKAASWEPSEEAKAGHLVLALGRPGESTRVSLGIVSTVGSSWITPSGGRVDRYLQSDKPLLPGFSGGPLLDMGGRCLGVNTSALLRGIAITVPHLTVRKVVEELMAHGTIRRAYLGVVAQPVTLPESVAKQIGQETGLLLISVAQDSPAERSGLALGDVIVSLGGQPVRQVEDLMSTLVEAKVRKKLALRVLRANGLREVAVEVGEHP